MDRKILDNRSTLIEICEKKLRLLKSVSEHLSHIESNNVFIEEIQDAYMEFHEWEMDLVADKAITLECPNCGFECDQIHSFCLACGNKLHDQQGMTTA